MAGSKPTSATSLPLRHTVDRLAYPSRSPGLLGINDAADPSHFSLLGDTPGPTGFNDSGSPRHYVLPGLNTYHEWLEENANHIPPDQQLGAAIYGAGSVGEVLAQAATFLIDAESILEHPYVPVNKKGDPIRQSGITIGVGYDLGQQTEKKIREDWAELDTRAQPPSIDPSKYNLGITMPKVDESLAGFASSLRPLNEAINQPGQPLAPPPGQVLKQPLKLKLDPIWTDPSPLDLIAGANGLRRYKALDYLKKIKHLTVFKDLGLKVFKDKVLPDYYKQTANFFRGLEKLPTGVQVAFLSLVYNTGTGGGGKVLDDSQKSCAETSMPTSFSFGLKPISSPSLSDHITPLTLPEFGARPAPPKFSLGLDSSKSAAETTEVCTSEVDALSSIWEKQQLKKAVHDKDLVWIYWYFESSRRIYANGPDAEPGLVKRREQEAGLILPYVYGDLQMEAFKRRFQRL